MQEEIDKKMKPKKSILLLAAVVALVLSAAGTASASPAWKFSGTELSGSETVVGAAISSSMTIPGATTECKHFLYNMKISNSAGTGKGEITELPLFECSTNTTACTVESIAAEKFPWATHLTAVGGSDYIVVEGVDVQIAYAGSLCALSGSRVIVKGSAGGIINNTNQTATFNKTTFTATGTKLKYGATEVEWLGEFPTEGFEKHREELLEVA
jgi:hypothetical protein